VVTKARGAFFNAVLEHVGGDESQRRLLVAEVVRAGSSSVSRIGCSYPHRQSDLREEAITQHRSSAAVKQFSDQNGCEADEPDLPVV